MCEEIFILNSLAASIADGISSASGVEVTPCSVHIPARGAEAGIALAAIPGEKIEPFGLFDKLKEYRFPNVLGVDAVRYTKEENGWLLFHLSDSFYEALIRQAQTWPLPSSDMGKLSLNRMLMLRRQGRDGCPNCEPAKNALFLTLCAVEAKTAVSRAEEALLSFADTYSPKDRMELIHQCGDMADAACRMLFRAYTHAKGK